MKLFVMPYRKGSNGAREMRDGLEATMIKTERSRYRPKANHLVVNWGNAEPNVAIGDSVLNKPLAVGVAVNKLTAFRVMQEAGVSVPEFTTDVNVARAWAQDEKVVFCRTLLRSSEGKGIVLARTPAEVVAAPLYTKRVAKRDEFRVHVFKGEVIDAVQKRLRRDAQNDANHNAFIRNHDNGWVFAHENVVVPDAAKAEAIKAVEALNLDFGAVDLAVTARGRVYVFEVNTAPGLENKATIVAYVNAIKNYNNKKEEEKEYAKQLKANPPVREAQLFHKYGRG